MEALEVKEQILGILGKHPRIVHLKWKHEDGLLLEYLPNGSVEHYLRSYATYTSAEQYGCAKRITTAISVFIEGWGGRRRGSEVSPTLSSRLMTGGHGTQ